MASTNTDIKKDTEKIKEENDWKKFIIITLLILIGFLFLYRDWKSTINSITGQTSLRADDDGNVFRPTT